MCRTNKNQFGHVQNLQKSIRTCAELTKINSDMCRTYKKQFGHVQNLQKSIRTCAELTKINSDMCRAYKNQFGHVQNLQDRSKYSSKFGQMHAPPMVCLSFTCPWYVLVTPIRDSQIILNISSYQTFLLFFHFLGRFTLQILNLRSEITLMTVLTVSLCITLIVRRLCHSTSND